MCFRGRVKKYCMQCLEDVGPTDPRLLPIETVRCPAYMHGDRSRCPGVIETDQTLSTDEGIMCQRCRENIIRNAERAGRENREREADRMATTDATAVEAPADTIMEVVVPTAICPTEQTVIMDRTVIMAPMVITDRMDLVITDTTAIIERVCAKPTWRELLRHQSCIEHND
ncbi:hypothetical protein LTR10_017165 [Elasticomyces elasticus]|uniref:RING-type domain-containing protein n=1 Tax=Exophiala sideris TaxID=1016849 RepID=A0ABR0J542_9EURO|nr:hypothetical protein LTR10_017165 [Elasticomyces elasticus]KAK5028479.1 hypothetical protein LTS07_006570 [Exophiala sideris]KAK5035879.1 hypothetical protein LTR13_005449 [Exophiala sideris]KAK5056915.1 hypothetical protein LTR69_007553 [Exophiala sideris]KAK5181322.1 hypothetical protein LTR44_006117 [Eurotiomycetes sp. CCFEE 6388]